MWAASFLVFGHFWALFSGSEKWALLGSRFFFVNAFLRMSVILGREKRQALRFWAQKVTWYPFLYSKNWTHACFLCSNFTGVRYFGAKKKVEAAVFGPKIDTIACFVTQTLGACVCSVLKQRKVTVFLTLTLGTAPGFFLARNSVLSCFLQNLGHFWVLSEQNLQG